MGDAGNAPDNTTYGAVDHSYRISKYEMTNGQYIEFLNKVAATDTYGLYNGGMAGTYGGIAQSGSPGSFTYAAKGGDANWLSRPVNYVSFWDAARLANWMHNGQPTGVQGPGTTEDGAYINIGNQATFARQPGALFFIPTEDEWYKAAYYKGGSLNAGYWDYPIRSDTAPKSEAPPGTVLYGSANYFGTGSAVGAPYYFSIVGAYTFMPSSSPYGTFDQGGNLWEWNETVLYTSFRGIRGGSWYYDASSLSASYRNITDPSDEFSDIGFRLAGPPVTTEIPEPATVSLLGIAVAAMLRRRKRPA